MSKDFGILYVATGKKYLQEAIRAAKSVKAMMPDTPICLNTDLSRDEVPSLFDEVRVIAEPKHSMFDKIPALLESPFEKTLFLDTDTLVIDPIYDLIPLLDIFEMAGCHAPHRVSRKKIADPAVPYSFSEINTGVIAYRKTAAVRQFLQAWENRYIEKLPQTNKNQLSFRETLYFSNVKFYVLPPEYNARTHIPAFKGGQGYNIRIVHGRDPQLSRAARYANALPHAQAYDFRYPEWVLKLLRKFGTQKHKWLNQLSKNYQLK